MSRVITILITVAWGVWFGAMVMLFIALASIFSTAGVDRQTAGDVAAGLFPKFERMQLILAAICLVGTTAWWVLGKSAVKLALFALFALATVTAVFQTTSITPRIEEMRARGERTSLQFAAAHRTAERVYTVGAVILLVAGIMLPAAIRADEARRTAGAFTALPRTSEETPPA